MCVRERERERVTSLFILWVCSTVSNLWYSCSTERYSRRIKIGKTRIQSVQIYIYYRDTVGTDIGTAGVQPVQTRHFEFAERLIFRDETIAHNLALKCFSSGRPLEKHANIDSRL